MGLNAGIIQGFPTLFSWFYTNCGALRRSEMLGLTLKDVSFNPCVLQIRDTKGCRDRGQVIAEPFSAWIRDWYNTRLLVTGNQDSILCTFSESTFYRKYKKLFGAGCHSARATAATNLLQTGFDHLAVQKLLGHSSLAMVEVYDKRWNSLENHPGQHLFKNLLTKSA